MQRDMGRNGIMLTRRFFIGGAASCFALGPGRIFAATGETVAAGRPELSLGVVSDIHIALDKGGKRLNRNYMTDTFKATLTRFRDAGADVVVIAGDMAHHGLGRELIAVGEAWDSVFPGGRAPDGRKVERIFVTGNHDNGPARAKRVLSDNKAIRENLIAADYKKWWDRAFHEEWKPVFFKTVKGYQFVGFNWVIGDCRGRDENFNPEIADWYAKNGGKIDPSRPFFHIQHPHPQGTVHGPVWGQDDGMSTQALMSRPNAIAFSGHSHISLTDERSVWQGGFTSIGCGSLRNVSLQAPGSCKISSGAGFENYTTPSTAPKDADAMKAMGIANRFNCRQEQFLRVYSDRVLISRREAISGESYGPDLVMPLPAAERRPFDFKMREAKAMAPEFPAGAALTVKRVKGHVRGTPGAKNRKVPVWEITIPRADAVRNARAAAYTLDIKTSDGSTLALGVIDEGFRFPAESARGKACAVCRVACERIPKGGFTVAVRAVSCWGRSSSPIEAKV